MTAVLPETRTMPIMTFIGGQELADLGRAEDQNTRKVAEEFSGL